VDPMANELLHNGIKRFADDIEKLERIVEAKVA
jgi:transaldolase